MLKYERETVINYNDGEGIAAVYTCNRALINKLDSFCLKSPFVCKGKSDGEGANYTLPKKCISIRFPRTITEEKRIEMARRAREQFGHWRKKRGSEAEMPNKAK